MGDSGAFGQMPTGETVRAARIAAHGLSARVLTYGGTLQSLRLEGHDHALALGLDDLKDYLAQPIYMGATIGRYANRIKDGQVAIDGNAHQLDRNFLDRHLLHGGRDGTGRRNWRIAAHSPDTVTLRDVLPDGHMGFPGELTVDLIWRILPGPALELEITATTTAPTVCNFAHHSYFNLDGADTARDHFLTVPADHYLPVSHDLIPNAGMARVDGTAFDLRRPRRLGDVADAVDLDHSYCFDAADGLQTLAVLKASQSGITLTIDSTERALQVYAGRHTDLARRAGIPLPRHAGIALEPQNWPNAPNDPAAPDATLRPGQTYRQVTQFRFNG